MVERDGKLQEWNLEAVVGTGSRGERSRRRHGSECCVEDVKGRRGMQTRSLPSRSVSMGERVHEGRRRRAGRGAQQVP